MMDEVMARVYREELALLKELKRNRDPRRQAREWVEQIPRRVREQIVDMSSRGYCEEGIRIVTGRGCVEEVEGVLDSYKEAVDQWRAQGRVVGRMKAVWGQ